MWDFGAKKMWDVGFLKQCGMWDFYSKNQKKIQQVIENILKTQFSNINYTSAVLNQCGMWDFYSKKQFFFNRLWKIF